MALVGFGFVGFLTTASKREHGTETTADSTDLLLSVSPLLSSFTHVSGQKSKVKGGNSCSGRRGEGIPATCVGCAQGSGAVNERKQGTPERGRSCTASPRFLVIPTLVAIVVRSYSTPAIFYFTRTLMLTHGMYLQLRPLRLCSKLRSLHTALSLALYNTQKTKMEPDPPPNSYPAFVSPIPPLAMRPNMSGAGLIHYCWTAAPAAFEPAATTGGSRRQLSRPPPPPASPKHYIQ